MENVRVDSLLGNKKVIVGNPYSDIVLETLGKVYVKTGNNLKVLSDVLKLLEQSNEKDSTGTIIVDSQSAMEEMEYPGDGKFIFNGKTYNNIDKTLEAKDLFIKNKYNNYSEIINSWNNIYKAYSIKEFEEKISTKKLQQKDTTEKQKKRVESGEFYEEIKQLNKDGYPNSIIALKLNIDEKKVKQTVRLLDEKNDPHLLTSLYKTIVNINTGIKTTSSNTYIFRFGKDFNGNKRKTIEEAMTDKVKILLEKTLSYPFLNNLIKETYNV